MKKLRIFALPLLFLLNACHLAAPACDYLAPPLFAIKKVERTGDPAVKIKEVSLSGFSFEGEAISADVLFVSDELWAYATDNSDIQGDVVTCEPLCEFGFDAPEGLYTFDLAAPDYKPRSVEVEAAYLPVRFPARCASSKKPMTLELSLEPLPN